MIYAFIGFCCGFIASSSYICSFVLFHESKEFPDNLRDSCLALILMAYTFSLLTSSLMGFLFDVLLDQ